MFNKALRLGELIGMSEEAVIENIDKGMWDILIELNEKNYYTIFCCEGHLNNENKWNGYLAFDKTYKFAQYPPKFTKVNKHNRFFFWEGIGEENRQEFLNNVLNWAKTLPTREKTKVVQYHLLAKNKKHPNREAKSIIYTDNYEDIKCILNRADMDNYFNFELVEDIRYI